MFLALIGSDIWWLAVTLVVMSIVSAGYYLRVVIYMYMYEPVSKARLNFAMTEMFTVAFMAVLFLYSEYILQFSGNINNIKLITYSRYW